MDFKEIERKAANTEEMPEGLNAPEQWLFLSTRLLYEQFRNGTVSKEQAKIEKRKVISQCELALLYYKCFFEASQKQNKISHILTDAEKSGCEICKKIVKIFDGRELK